MSERAAAPLLRARAGRWALGGIAAVAVAEWVASAVAYRPAVQPADWAAASMAIAELPSDEPIRLGTPWLGPRARMHLPRLAREDAIGRPDLRGSPRVHVLGLDGDDWARPLQDDLEDLPAPTLVDTRPLGGLALYTYELRAAGVTRADFVRDAASLVVRTDAGPCRGRHRRRCEDGRVEVTVAEIDYRARRCLKVDVSDGVTVRLRYPQMPTGDVLRGHVGVHDFNARLRSDAPLRLRVRIDEQPVAQWLVTDAQGWWPLAVKTEPGEHDVELELTPAASGTWQRSGYDSGQRHSPCVELRSIQEDAT